MRIAFFYRVWQESGENFLAAAAKLGVELVPIFYGDLVLKQKEMNWDLFFKGEPLSNFDIFYLRSVGTEEEWAALLVLLAKEKGIPFVDDYLGKWGAVRRLKSISGMILGRAGVAYPRTEVFSELEVLPKMLKKWSWPLVAKISKGGRHGLGTFLVHNEEDLLKVAKGRIKGTSFLLQEYIPNDGDYRVFVLGYKVLAAFKRQAKEKKLILNTSLGFSEVLEEIPDKVRETAEAAAKALQVEVAAVDMVRDKRTGEMVVIELNEAPEFKVLEKRTGMDVAEKIVEYLLEKSAVKKG